MRPLAGRDVSPPLPRSVPGAAAPVATVAPTAAPIRPKNARRPCLPMGKMYYPTLVICKRTLLSRERIAFNLTHDSFRKASHPGRQPDRQEYQVRRRPHQHRDTLDRVAVLLDPGVRSQALLVGRSSIFNHRLTFVSEPVFWIWPGGIRARRLIEHVPHLFHERLPRGKYSRDDRGNFKSPRCVAGSIDD